MKFVSCIALGVMIVILCGCGTTQVIDSKLSEPLTESDQKEPPESERIYYFQHKLIAKWLFESEGRFYNDLRVKNIDKLVQVAEELVSSDFSSGIAVVPIENQEAVLITFPEPMESPNCYFSMIVKGGEGYSYYTYEKSLQIIDKEFYGVVGGWSKKGGHRNYGSRTYKSSSEFVKDVLEKK